MFSCFFMSRIFLVCCVFLLIAIRRWYSSSKFFSSWLSVDVISSTKTWLIIDVFSRSNSSTCWTVYCSNAFDEIIVSKISFFERMFKFCVSASFWLRVIDKIIIDFTLLFNVYNYRCWYQSHVTSLITWFINWRI